jgi:phosphatidate cytidylyltransferase
VSGEGKKSSNLALRFAIGIPVGAIVVCLLAFGSVSLMVFIVILAWLSLREFWRLTGVDRPGVAVPLARVGEIAIVILLFTTWAYPDGSFAVMLAVALPIFFIYQLVRRAHGADSYLREIAVVTLGVIYIGGLLSFIFRLRHLQIFLEESGALTFSTGFFHIPGMIHFTIFAVIASWGCDTAALLSGKYFGRAKLAPNISPKKTIAGLVGGMFGSATAVVIYAWLVGLIGQVAIYELIAFGAMTAAFSQLGDLTVSAIKREANLKDTSSLLGPHGGVLDRIDGFLFALPATYIFFLLVLG